MTAFSANNRGVYIGTMSLSCCQYADADPVAGLLEADEVCVWLHWNFSCLLFA